MSRSKTLRGRDEIERYVRALSCEATSQLARVLAIPDRTKLKKRQLNAHIVAYFLRVPGDSLLQLECPKTFGRSCSEEDFQSAFSARVAERYEGERKYKTDQYQGTVVGPDGTKEGDLFAKCEIKSGAVVFVHELDTYAFQVNGCVKLLVAALKRVEVKPGAAPKKADAKSAAPPSSSSSSPSSSSSSGGRPAGERTAPKFDRLKPGLGGGEPPETEKALVSRDTAEQVARVLDGVWNAALNWNLEEARGVPDTEVEADEGKEDEDDEAYAARLQRLRTAEAAANPNVERVQLVVDTDASLNVQLRNSKTSAVVELDPIRIAGTYGLRLFLQRLAQEFEYAATRALLPRPQWEKWLRQEFGAPRARTSALEEDTGYLGDLGRLGRRERKTPLPIVPSAAIYASADRGQLSLHVEGHSLRWRGVLACYVGESAQQAAVWSPWHETLPGYSRLRDPRGAKGAVDFTRAGSRGGGRRLRFALDSARNDGFRIALLPGGFFDLPAQALSSSSSSPPPQKGRKTERAREDEEEREEDEDEKEDDTRDRELEEPREEKTERELARERKASLVQSAVALGMDWEASPSLRVGESYVLPHTLSASLYARPTFGAGAHDCAPGWVRQPGYTGCCVYVIGAALRTIAAKKLAACVQGECAGLEERDAAEIQNYVRGVEQGQKALQSYVGGLKLTSQQLQWTMTMAANVKEAWLRQLTQQMNDMLEDAGMSIHDEDCNTEALAGEVVPQPSAAAAGEEKKGKAAAAAAAGSRGSRLFFWAAHGVLSSAYALAKATGNVLVWALGWLWRFSKSTLVASGNLVAGVATKGMHLASWILSDPRRARFILVLVRRMRITLCKRVGLYLMENGYAQQFTTEESRRHLEVLKDQSATAAWATDVGEDVASLAKQELSAANLTASLYGGSAGQKVVGAAGRVLAKGLQGALMSVPIVGGFLAGAGEVVGDLVGESANNAMKQALEVQRVNSELGNTLELLRDIFDLNGALRDAGFTFQVDYEKLFAALAARVTGAIAYAAPVLRGAAAVATQGAAAVADRLAPVAAASGAEEERPPTSPPKRRSASRRT